MFTLRQTDLHPGFQTTVAEVCDYLRMFDAEHSDHHGSILYELTGCDEPEELITENQYAMSFLESHPEYLRPAGLHLNDSEDALVLWKQLHLPKYEIVVGYHQTNNLDTYLQDANVDLVDFRTLSSNPRAFPFLRKHLDRIEWNAFNKNPEALDLLEYYTDKISYYYLSFNTNPRAIDILRENLDQVCWEALSSNPSDAAIDLLAEYPTQIDYTILASNENDRAIALLLRHRVLDDLNWWGLSSNPCHQAVALLVAYPEKIKWNNLCSSAKTKAQFELLRNHPDKIDWDILCLNDSEFVLALLLEHPDKIEWWYTLAHQNVFATTTTYDYAGIRGARHDLHEEFHARVGHPSMVQKWRDWELEDFVGCLGMDMEMDEV